MARINVALAGVGSFAKALVEGVAFYTRNPHESTGLMHLDIGGYRVPDIHFVAAFDVDERKVGTKLHEAVSAGANVGARIAEPLHYDAVVQRGPTLDGVVQQMRGTFVQESSGPAVDIAEVLKSAAADVLVNLVPTGGQQATYAYAEAALRAGCNFINCIPTPLATLSNWRNRFTDHGLVLLGDDIKSQFGATMLNRTLLELLGMRGVTLIKSEQENRGGNADHFNLLYRAQAKEKTKREALARFLPSSVEPIVKFSYTGKPSSHKVVNITIEGRMFACVPIALHARIDDEISANGAGTLVDAIRVAKFLVDRGEQKKAEHVCAFLMKSPPVNMTDSQAAQEFEHVLAS